MKTAKLITVDKNLRAGEVQTDISPANGKNFTLDECYKAIECDLIEVVYLTDNQILIVDEEGLLKSDWVMNITASLVAGQPIVGNAILCHTSMLK